MRDERSEGTWVRWPEMTAEVGESAGNRAEKGGEVGKEEWVRFVWWNDRNDSVWKIVS